MRKGLRILTVALTLVGISLIGYWSAPAPVAAQTGVLTGYLTDNVLLTKVADHSAANTTDVTGTSVDLQNYTGVVFLTSYGTAASNNTCHAETSSDDGSADAYTDLTGTEVGVSTSDEDVWLEIARPVERYMRVVCQRGTSSTLESVWAIRYGNRTLPADNTTAGTIHGETHNAPAAGTK